MEQRIEEITTGCEGAEAQRDQEKKANLVLTSLLLAVYIATLIYGFFEYFNPTLTTSSQALLIILQCSGGLVLAVAPYLLEKLFHIKLAFPIRFALEIFGVMGIVLGEGFRFYYRLDCWDDILHFASGFGVAFLGASTISNLNKKSESQHRIAIAIGIGVLLSFSVAFVWELFEYSMDVIFKTNMQKCLPEITPLFNGGDTSAILGGTDEEIAAFFRSPEGYRYALMDTMGDLWDCFLGTMGFVLVGLAVGHHKETAFDNLVIFGYGKAGRAPEPSEK